MPSEADQGGAKRPNDGGDGGGDSHPGAPDDGDANVPGPGAWRYSRQVMMDTTTAGAGVSGDVANFPVPVILDETNFDFNQAQPAGEDVRFSTRDGAKLPYEIESWDRAAKSAALWVQVDVKGNDNSQLFVMSWGNADAKDASNSEAVFDTKAGFVGTWHLSDPPSTAAGGYKDATATGAHATGVALTASSSGDGRIGKAALLHHAQKQWIEVPVAKSKPYDAVNQVTASVWVRAASHTVEYQCMFSKGEAGFRIHYYGLSDWDENHGKNIVESCVEGAEDECAVNIQGTDVAPGKWFHLVMVQNHPKLSTYVNGVLQKTEMDSGRWKSDPNKPVMIGNNSSSTGRSFDGLIDEARFMNVAQDANWIKLDYESQREGQKFLSLGPVQTAQTH